MMPMKRHPWIPAIVIGLTACGGGDAPADSPAGGGAATAQPAAPPSSMPPPPGGLLTIPDWYAVDHDARTVQMTITAGSTPDNNYWNFNGAIKGELAITVPVGYTVSMELVNNDPNMPHSLGIQADFTDPMLPPTPNPVFEGAVTENPQSMVEATMPGERETIEFVADTAGEYTMICYIAGHTALGMWLYFNVAADDAAGVQGL
jgi:FtsP/CotA-like multicopper oxidase with cupredoxin domain